MSVDKNLFMYNLSVAAIMKNEAPYIKEWLDYNLLAGVEHFYIYDNDSPDNMKEILQPYIEKNIVTYIFYPGKARQYEAYMDAVTDFRFESRHIAFIDGDEFIFPQSDRSIVEVLDEIFEEYPKTGGVAINWHQFGSNNLETADYSRGVMERFTMRASDENIPILEESGYPSDNAHVKTIANPRRIDYFYNPHFAVYLKGCEAINEKGGRVKLFFNNPPTVEKLVINHYGQKSREEYLNKVKRGAADYVANIYAKGQFTHRFNDVFDDGILNYRDTRKKNFCGEKNILEVFPLESHDDRIQRVMDALLKNFSGENMKNVTENIFSFDIETLLTWRAVSEKLNINFKGQYLEEFILKLICARFSKLDNIDFHNGQQFVKALPEIFSRPFPVVDDIRKIAEKILSMSTEAYRMLGDWRNLEKSDYVLRLLKSI